MRLRVAHRTTYQYAQPMVDGYTLAYLLPRPTAWQIVERAEVDVDPTPDERAERVAAFGRLLVDTWFATPVNPMVVHGPRR